VSKCGGVPSGIRTRVAAVKGRCPRPLDDGDRGEQPAHRPTVEPSSETGPKSIANSTSGEPPERLPRAVLVGWPERHERDTTPSMSTYSIRLATEADADVIAGQRAAMFRDMGNIDKADIAPLMRATAAWLRVAMPAGEYVGWMAQAGDAPERVIGGAGMQLRALIPRHRSRGRGILEGRQGLIVNVFVERAYRRQGVARALTQAALTWGRQAGLASIVLHASPAGRPLYDTLGFVPTNEMRYDGER